MDKWIPQMEPDFGVEEAEALRDYVLRGGWGTEFTETKAFEEKLAEFTGTKFAVATNNGTVSLQLALVVLGIKPGDEVLVPNLSMIATANACKLIGAEPVFVDVERNTACMDPADLAQKISKRSKAVIYVSFNGRAGALQEVQRICEERDLELLEDAAQSLGSRVHGQHLGTFGKIGSFSFSSPKIITTGQGGALVTNSEPLAQHLRRMKDFGRERGGVDLHDEIAGNFKFTDFQAVVGLKQLQKLEWRVRRKKEIFTRYREELAGVAGCHFLSTDLSQTCPWFVDLFVERREDLMQYLKDASIGTRVIYPPIHSQKAYGLVGNFPATEALSSTGLWLPSSTKLSDTEISRITSKIREFYRA